MEQYTKKGPPPNTASTEQSKQDTITRRLEQKIESLEKIIKDQEREINKIKNRLRMTINAFNRSNNG